MRLKNIECQLAQGQIGRYLAGTDMSPEAVSQLELHIAECGDCSEFIEVKRRALKEIANQSKAVAFIEADEKPDAAEALVQILQEKSTPGEKPAVLETKREPAPTKPIHWKAFIYSGALGLVLLLMSHFTANPTALFGERAADKVVPAAEEPKVEAALASRDPFAEEPKAGELRPTEPLKADEKPPAPTTEPAKPAQTPTISKSSTPPIANSAVQVTSRPVTRRKPRQIRRATQQPRRSANSIRVYDENGRPISGA